MDTELLQLGSLSVSEPELKEIDDCLDLIRSEIHTTAIMLLDQSGQVIASHHNRGAPEESTLGALIAGSFFSSREIARVLKEKEFKSLTQQGQRETIYAEVISNQWILVVIFRKQNILGLVRVICRQAVVDLQNILEKVKQENRSGKHLSDRFRPGELGNVLDLIFKDLESGTSTLK